MSTRQFRPTAPDLRQAMEDLVKFYEKEITEASEEKFRLGNYISALQQRVDKSEAEKENVWLVSANSFDVIGACAVGINTIWLDREGTESPRGSSGRNRASWSSALRSTPGTPCSPLHASSS